MAQYKAGLSSSSSKIIYPEETDPNAIQDIVKRKEFQLFKVNNDTTDIIPYFLIKNAVSKGTYLELRSYQLFTKNYLNPHTKFSRLLIKWETGLGKTSGALAIALNFINYYQKQEEYITGDLNLGSVFILGFTQQIFKDELLKHPEFGFISRDELEKLNKLKRLALSNMSNPIDIENLKKFMIMLKKRLTSRKGNGFFRFIGYKELTNHLFLKKEDVNIASVTEAELASLVEAGKVKLNQELLNSFANSLIICDEIHNVYNSTEKNNWGVALQTILNYHKSCRALFLSATPLNNSPTEVVDLLNLLLPRQYYPELRKTDFFDKNENLLKEKENELATLLKSRVSYARSRNTQLMATKQIEGEVIPGIEYLKFIRCNMSKFHYNTYKTVLKDTSDSFGQDSQYMFDFALPNPKNTPYDTQSLGIYKARDVRELIANASVTWKNKAGIQYNSKQDIITGPALRLDSKLPIISAKYTKLVEILHSILKHGHGKTFIYHNNIHISGTLFIQEILSQNGFIGESDVSNDSTLCALCGNERNKHSKAQLDFALFQESLEPEATGGIEKRANNNIIFSNEKSREWFNRNNIRAELQTNPNLIIELPSGIDGHQLDVEYYIANNGKTYLIGEAVKSIQDKEQYISTAIKGNLKCVKGGAEHFYHPARFVIVHSELDKRTIHNSLEKFNHINNIDGSKYCIIIGSRIIRESHSMNSVRNLILASRPDNISTMIQIFGRVIRMNSHALLPVEQRNVKIKILTSKIPGSQEMSLEERKYLEKINTYKVIQRIDKIMHENAVDASFNYDMIWQESKEDFGLSILKYEKPLKNSFSVNELNLSTFNAFHAKYEVEYIMYIIKRLFLEYSPVWKYGDMLKAVKAPPFSVEINTPIISEDLFQIALTNLLFGASAGFVEPHIQKMHDSSHNLMDKIRNPNDKILREKGQVRHMITHYGEFYLLMPVVNEEVNMNPESVFRDLSYSKQYLMDVVDYLKYDMDTNYPAKRLRFIKKWETVSITHLELAVCDFGINFHREFLEELIEYIFKVWTDPEIKKHEYHNFFIKMLYYYDLQKLVAWAHTVGPTVRKKYEKFANPVSVKFLNKALAKEITTAPDEESSGFVNLLISSINRSDPKWISTGMVKEYENKLTITNALFDGLYKKNKRVGKVPANLLPVGHFLAKLPRFFIPKEGWHDDPTYSSSTTTKENPIIIGYDSRSKTGLSVKFKLRTPTQNIKKNVDSRTIEKGAICSTKSKTYLQEIAKKLGIVLNKEETMNVETLCSKIRSKLIYNELKERVDKKSQRWFYFVYEQMQ